MPKQRQKIGTLIVVVSAFCWWSALFLWKLQSELHNLFVNLYQQRLDLDNSNASYFSKVFFIFFFCLNVISYYCYTNSHEPYYYSCIFHSGTSHGCQVLFASSNNPLYCFSERFVSFIELPLQTLSLQTPTAGDSCSEWRMHTDLVIIQIYL